MAQTSQISITKSSWTQIPGVSTGKIVKLEARYSFYIVYSDSTPSASSPTYLIEDNKDTTSSIAIYEGTALGTLWAKSKDQDQTLFYTTDSQPVGTIGTISSITNPVNVIPNITRGGGAIDSNTQRVTLATDGPGVANLATIATNTTTTKNTGAVDANTLRVTLATDGPGVGNLSTIATNTGRIPAADNSKTPVIPSMTTGGNVSVTTAATGTNWTAFASQACKQLTISNQTGTTIEFRQGATGVGFQVPTGSFYTFFGLSNANAIDARRVDTSNTQVTVTARWES